MTNRTFLTIVTGVIILWFMIGALLFLTKPVIETNYDKINPFDHELLRR